MSVILPILREDWIFGGGEMSENRGGLDGKALGKGLVLDTFWDIWVASGWGRLFHTPVK